MKRLNFALIIFILLGSGRFVMAQNSTDLYKISDRIPLTGDGGWDYLTVDSVNSRLFVSHSTMVQVVDLKTNKQCGVIDNLKGVHGIAIAYALNKGFISNGKDSTVTVFELNSLKVTDRVKVTGKNPDAVLYDPFTKRVFTFNGGSNNATVIDATNNKVIGSIYLDGKPEFAVTDNKGKIWVNIENIYLVDQLNPETMHVDNRWSVTPGDNPSGLAIDLVNRRLFVACGNSKMIIMDADLGNVIINVTTDYGTDGIAWDPKLKRAYSSNGDGTFTIVQEVSKDKYVVLKNMKTQKGARTIALDYKTNKVYLPFAEYGPPPPVSIDNARPRAAIKPGTFQLLEISPVTAGK